MEPLVRAETDYIGSHLIANKQTQLYLGPRHSPGRVRRVPKTTSSQRKPITHDGQDPPFPWA